MGPSESVANRGLPFPGVRGPAWRRALARVLILAFASGPAMAHGQEDAERTTAAARSLFEEGVAHSDAARWTEAADHFRRSLSMRYSPVVAFNLATALTHTGRLVEAGELFLRVSRDEEAPQRVRNVAREQLSALEPRLGRLTIELEGSPENVAVELDGQRVPPELLGVASAADPGAHVLRALRDDVEVARVELEITEGGERTARLRIPPPRVASPSRPTRAIARAAPLDAAPPASGPSDGWVWFGVIAGVLVVAAAITIPTVLVLEGEHGPPIVEGNLGPSIIVFE